MKPEAPLKRLQRFRPVQAGFSLIELMIAVTLGLVILAALTTFFVQTSGNRTEMERNTRQIENGRYAIDSVREDVTLAGFYADTSPGVVPEWILNDVCPPDVASFGFALAGGYKAPVPVRGYANGVGVPGCLKDLVPATDVIAVRRFHTEPLTVAEAAAGPNNVRFFLQNSQCTADDPNFPFVTGLGSGAGTPGGSFNLQRVACGGQPSTVWRMREQVYYLRTCSVCAPDAPVDNIPTLWRAELDPADLSTDGDPLMKHSALVEGIEQMRFDYGVDTSGDGLADRWLRCDAATPCDAATLGNVMAVKAYVLSRTLEESRDYKDEKTYAMGLSGSVGPFNDKYKRHVYSVLISLPNRSGSREPQLAAAP
jgi:type IV pilus assembly protein PilW